MPKKIRIQSHRVNFEAVVEVDEAEATVAAEGRGYDMSDDDERLSAHYSAGLDKVYDLFEKFKQQAKEHGVEIQEVWFEDQSFDEA